MVMWQAGLWLTLSQRVKHFSAVAHLKKPWSCDLECSRSLPSSPLLWRKLLQLFAEHNIPLISCQLCRAEQFLTDTITLVTASSLTCRAGAPFLPTSGGLVCSTVSSVHMLPFSYGSSSSHAGSLSQWSAVWLVVLAASRPPQQGNKMTIISLNLSTMSIIFFLEVVLARVKGGGRVLPGYILLCSKSVQGTQMTFLGSFGKRTNPVKFYQL